MGYLESLVTFGGVCLTILCVKLAIGVYRAYFRPAKKLGEKGDWAIVTGGTDGIGKAMACEIARKHLNIFLIGRSAEKLAIVEDEIQKKYRVETASCVVDFSDLTPEAIKLVVDTVGTRKVKVLLNNVGMSYNHAMYLHELPEERLNSIVEMNCRSTVMMTKAIIPLMLESKGGFIVNMGSAYGDVPAPLYSVYSASKAFVAAFSRSMTAEYAPKIHVQNQAPLLVVSKLSKIRKPDMVKPLPATYAKYAVNRIGYDVHCSPYPIHQLILSVANFLPEFVLSHLLTSHNSDIRKRALKKLASQS